MMRPEQVAAEAQQKNYEKQPGRSRAVAAAQTPVAHGQQDSGYPEADQQEHDECNERLEFGVRHLWPDEGVARMARPGTNNLEIHDLPLVRSRFQPDLLVTFFPGSLPRSSKVGVNRRIPRRLGFPESTLFKPRQRKQLRPIGLP